MDGDAPQPHGGNTRKVATRGRQHAGGNAPNGDIGETSGAHGA